MRAFFCLLIFAVFIRAPSRAGSLPQLTELSKWTRSNVGASLLAMGPVQTTQIYRLETR
jgi:hypothetical protein